MKPINKNIVWQSASVSRENRELRYSHRSCVVWFTGLSGAGKSSLANAVERRLFELGVHTYVLDGDNVRHGLCSDLGFSSQDRTENIRRIGEVAHLFVQAGVVVLTAFISPFLADRARVRSLMKDGEFIEVYCRCPIDVCEQRDVKGLYRKARNGELKEFTGISSPYEVPDAPELVVDTGSGCLEQSVDQVLEYLFRNGVVSEVLK